MLPVSLDCPFFIGPSVFSNVYLHVILLDAKDHIGGVMVSLIASSVVDRGLSPDRIKTKTMKLVFVASSLSTQHYGERAKISWL